MPKAHPRLYRKTPQGPWYAVVYDRGGTRHRVCTKRFDQRAAESELRRLEREYADERPEVSTSRHTVAEALDYLIANRGEGSNHYELRKPALVKHLGELDVNGLTYDHLQAFITHRLAEKVPNAARTVSRATVAKELKALKTVLRIAARRGLFKLNTEQLFPEFEAPYIPRKRFLTPGQFEALLAQLPRHRVIWLVLAAFTGGRRSSEVERITWAHVDWPAGQVTIPGTKTLESARVIPLHPALRRFLEQLRESLGGEPSGRIVVTWANQYKDLKRACEAVKIDRVTANDIRRTFASWMIQAGVSNAQVAKLLGHTTTTMVDRVYGKHSVESLRPAVDKLPEAHLFLPSANPVSHAREHDRQS